MGSGSHHRFPIKTLRTFRVGAQFGRVVRTCRIWVVSSHGNQAVGIDITYSGHTKGRDDQIRGQLTHIPDGDCWLWRNMTNMTTDNCTMMTFGSK